MHFGEPVAGDAFLGVSNVTGSARGTLAFATLFFGPLASNHVLDEEGFDALAAEFDGELPVEDGFYGNTALSFFRRGVAVPGGYDVTRNLTRAGLAAPRGSACGSEFVECVPGPCSVWEYDYQFAGLQMSQVGSVKDRVHGLNGSTFDYYPMVGTVRCGPLFGSQLVNNELPGGADFDPATSGKADEFNILGVVEPSALSETTLDYLPVALGADLEIYPVHGSSLAPVPHGLNLNPRWYYEGYEHCFNVQSGARLVPTPPACEEVELLMNWMYNMNPRALDCLSTALPPPYAPAGPLTVDDTSGPWVATGNATDEGPEMNEDPSLHPYRGNPRLQVARFADGDRRAALVGYVRGAEDGYFAGASENVTAYAVREGTTDKMSRLGGASISGQHWANGRGANHRITPQELPGSYTPGTCDFTQCRWVPQLPAPATVKHHVFKRRHGTNVDRTEVRTTATYAAPASAAYAVAASELSVPPVDAPLIRNLGGGTGFKPDDESGNGAFRNYSRHAAWLNRIRAYGRQVLRFKRDANTSWTRVPSLVERYGRGGFLLVGPGNRTATFGCVDDCILDAACAASGLSGQPCALDYQCQNATFNATFPCFNNANGTETQPLCCSEFDPFGIADAVQKSSPLDKYTTSEEDLTQHCLRTTEGLLFDVGKTYDEMTGTSLGCRNFFARNDNYEVVSKNPSDDAKQEGRCRYNDIAWSMVRDLKSPPSPPPGNLKHVLGDRTLPCYAMLGALSSARVAVVKHDDVAESSELLSERPVEWSRATSIDGSGVKMYDAKHKFKGPGFTPMRCVDDRQAFFYQLGTKMDYEYVKLIEKLDPNFKFEGDVKFSYRHNLIPTKMSLDGTGSIGNRYYNDGETEPNYGYSQQLFHANVSTVDGSFGSKCAIRTFNGVGGPKKQQTSNGQFVAAGLLPAFDLHPDDFEGTNCGILTMMTSHSPSREAGSKYRPLRAYYQETREAEPLSPVQRVAYYPNSNTLDASYACDCRNGAVVWRWLDVPRGDGPGFDLTGYRSSRVVLRSFSWRDPPLHTSPVVGLFLPSSRPVFKVAERDVLLNLSGVPRGEGFYDAAASAVLDASLSGVDRPGRAKLREFVFDGHRYERGVDPAAAFPGQVFRYGSCVRWPYGQVPRLGLDAATRDALYPNVSKRDYGLEAMMGYCERVSALPDGGAGDWRNFSGKMQACAHDPLAPQARDRFCREHGAASQHVVFGVAVSGSLRKFESVCNAVDRTCLVVPGRDELGSLRAVLQAHHRRFRDVDGGHGGENWTFFVTPFNTSVMDYLLANRTLGAVARGTSLETSAEYAAVADSDANVTGLAALPDVYRVLDHNVYDGATITAAMTKFRDALLNESSGCPAGEFRVPARSETAFSATECVGRDALFLGNPEAGGTVHFRGTRVVSAVPDMPLRFSAVRHDFKRCARLTVRAADVYVGPVEVDQTGCEMPATAFLVESTGVGLDLRDVTIGGGPVASAVTVAGAPGRYTPMNRSVIGVTFSAASTLPFRAHFAASGAVGNVAVLHNATVVLLPRPGGVLTLDFENGTRPDVIDLSSTIAEFAHGTLRRLYSTDAVGNSAWLVTVVTSVTLGSVFLLVLVYVVVRNSRRASNAQRKL